MGTVTIHKVNETCGSPHGRGDLWPVCPGGSISGSHIIRQIFIGFGRLASELHPSLFYHDRTVACMSCWNSEEPVYGTDSNRSAFL